MRSAICPGSFDPVTHGHLDIIRRAAAMFDQVTVVVMTNSQKVPAFTREERVDFLRRATADLPNVEVDAYGGLLAEYARLKGANVIVKGLRAMSDFEYEFQMALTNKKLYPYAETVFLTTSMYNMYLSSSLVRQIAMLGGDLSGLVPRCLHERVYRKFRCEEDAGDEH